MKILIGLDDRAEVELTDKGVEILKKYMLTKGFFLTTGSPRYQKFTIAEFAVIFGPHMSVTNGGHPLTDLIVRDELRISIGVDR